jgi:hypothetical protein
VQDHLADARQKIWETTTSHSRREASKDPKAEEILDYNMESEVINADEDELLQESQDQDLPYSNDPEEDTEHLTALRKARDTLYIKLRTKSNNI